MDLEATTRESEETSTESEMTEGTEVTITDPEEAPAKRTRRGVQENRVRRERDHHQHIFS